MRASNIQFHKKIKQLWKKNLESSFILWMQETYPEDERKQLSLFCSKHKFYYG